MSAAPVVRFQCPWCGAALPQLAMGWSTDADLPVRCGACRQPSPVNAGIWRAMGPQRIPRTPAQLTNRFPLTSRLYERAWRRRSLSLLSGRPFPLVEELRELTAWLAPAPGMVVVDVACSEGLYARTLAGSGAVVVAVDHSLPFLRATQRRAAAAGVTVLPVQASAQRLPLERETVDAVCMGGSLNEIGDQAAALTEMARICCAGAHGFTMSLVAADGKWGQRLQGAGRFAGITFPGEDDTLAALRDAGFAVVANRTDGVVLRAELVR